MCCFWRWGCGSFTPSRLARLLVSPGWSRLALARRLLIAVYATPRDGDMFGEDKFAAVEEESVNSMSFLLFESDAQGERRSLDIPMCLEPNRSMSATAQ